MPQPLAVTELADRLVAIFRNAQQSIDAEVAKLAGDPTRLARTDRLLELRRSIDRHLTALETDSRSWLQHQLPAVYGAGGEHAAAFLLGEFAWTQVHIGAVQSLASNTFEQVLQATRFVRQDVKDFIRDQARRETTAALLEGKTARQAGRSLADAVASEHVGVLRYADGSTRTIGDYGEMLARTETAVAYNTGTLTQCTEDGCLFMEVADGPDCGWEEHDDPDLADGSIRSVDECDGNEISHPNCLRSFLPRPDITSQEEADIAESIRDPESMADNADAARARAG